MTLRYDVLGRDDADAETVLFSAGLGGLGAYWRPQVPALTETFRVIVYDQRGTGANAEPLPAGHSVASMADDVAAILDDAGVARCHLVGHALGGLIGLALALQAPERVRSLVLVNAWSSLDSHTRRCFDARLALLDHAGPEAYVRAQPIFLYPAVWLSRNAERMEREDAHALGAFQGADNLRTRIAALLAFDARDRLGEIAAPVFVVAARDDVLVPFSCSEQLAGALPNATRWTAAEGGHALNVTNAAGFDARLAAFIAR